jgi:hypothetical protein
VNGAQVAALTGGLVILAAMFELLRRRQLREKYAILWIGVSLAVALFGLFPRLIDVIASPFHIADPPNLLLFMACAVLLLVVVQLSWEISRLEDRTRTLAEEVALLRHAIDGDRGSRD